MNSRRSPVTRQQLLKAGASTVLAVLYADSLQTKASASGQGSKPCCGPIDLIYVNKIQKTSDTSGPQELHGLRITDKSPDKMSAADLQTWTPMHHIVKPSVAGYDERGTGHGADDDTDPDHAQPLGYDIWIYHMA